MASHKRNFNPLLPVLLGWFCLLFFWPALSAQKKASSTPARTKTPAAGSQSSAAGGSQAGDAQAQDEADANPPPTPAERAAPPSGSRLILSEYEFWLSAEVLIFGFAVLLAEFLLLRRAKITAEEALRVYAVSLIIIGTLFAITAGFDSNQIAPAMGLFGTIAGYLLGKRPPGRDSAPEQEEK